MASVRHEERVAACLAAIDANPLESGLALTHVDRVGALRRARELDGERGGRPGTLAGRVCSVKACFDVGGWVTHAGSRALARGAPAARDAEAVARLRAHGAVVLAQTNMTEFAYGALGVNHWLGTPLTPLYPGEERVAGGSSSGAAVSVAMGFADFALCSDTSGSARIPAAFCGLAGYAPSRGVAPAAGMIGLSPSFDVPGVIAASVDGCARAVAAMADPGGALAPPAVREAGARTYAVLVPDHARALADPGIGAAFEAAMRCLEKHGVRVETRPLPCVSEAGSVAADGGIIAADAFSLHEQWLPDLGDDYDPLVRRRIEAGAQVPAYRYARAKRRLEALSGHYEEALDGFDAVLTPTCPMPPPPLAGLSDPDTYLRINKRSFVFTEAANRLNKPSISLPLRPPGARPAGLLLTGRANADQALLGLARRIEKLLNDNLNC